MLDSQRRPFFKRPALNPQNTRPSSAELVLGGTGE